MITFNANCCKIRQDKFMEAVERRRSLDWLHAGGLLKVVPVGHWLLTYRNDLKLGRLEVAPPLLGQKGFENMFLKPTLEHFAPNWRRSTACASPCHRVFTRRSLSLQLLLFTLTLLVISHQKHFSAAPAPFRQSRVAAEEEEGKK